jgi:hypothetical protein
MSRSDVFALEKSGLNTFLFAEVGTETNGSVLTVLSVLARLGRDPWEEAARWADLPKATIVDRLTQCITQMPLSEQALRDANRTALRLIQLLPVAPTLSVRTGFDTSRMPRIPRWAPMFLIAAALALTIGILLSQANLSVPARVNDPIPPSHATAATE